MFTLTVIIARAGSKGVPRKCIRELCGRAVIEYTFDHALASKRSDAIILSTDCQEAKDLAVQRGIECQDRPAQLAGDTASVQDTIRHIVREYESQSGQAVDQIVVLYGNVPIRPDDLVDRAITQLQKSGAEKVISVVPVGACHPDWMVRLEGDRMSKYRENESYRRQDLEPLYRLDGAIFVVTRDALFAKPDNPADPMGTDHRAIILQPEETVDIDEPIDLYLAEAVLRSRNQGS